MVVVKNLIICLIAGLCLGAVSPGLLPEKVPVPRLKQLAQSKDIAAPGRWQVQGPVVRFIGTLSAGDCGRFRRLLAPAITTLEVTSPGGQAGEGLCIGNLMRRHGFTRVVIRSICLSACANYLFLGAREKDVRQGIVGFHGNITALMRISSPDKMRRNLQARGVAEPRIRRIIAGRMAWGRQTSARELRFLKSIGVSQDLFERTQRPDKGTGRNAVYNFLFPTGPTFQRYGISGVVGQPRLSMEKTWGLQGLVE